MAEEEERKPEGGGEPRPTERTDSPQSPREPGRRSDKPTPKPELGQKPEAPKGGKTPKKDVPGTKGVPGAGEGKVPGAEGAKAPGGVPAPPAGIPKIPKGLEKDEEGKPRSPMGETPLEGAGKAAGGAKKGLEAGRKALETVPHPAAKAAAKAARVGEWAAGKAEEGMKKKGREISDAAKKEEAGEGEEDLEATAKAAAEKGKKRLKWLKWPAIFGCLGCGGCTGLIVTILLPILIIVVIIDGGGGEGEPQGTGGLEGAPAGALPVPFASQKASSCPSSYCGPTCGGMVWGYYSQNQNAQQLVEEIAKEANLGCRPSSEGYSISEWIGVLTSKEINYSESNGVTIRDLQERYYQGHPTMALVTLNSGIKHFVLIVGFSGDSIIYHDPLASSGFSQQSATEFQSRWTGWAGFWSGNAPYKPQRSTDQSYLPIILPPLAQPI